MTSEEKTGFVWDLEKEIENLKVHRLDFRTATRAFLDPKRKIFVDSKHSQAENRYFCIGRVEERIITVRFTFRENQIRIIGAGYWRKGKKYYEKEDI